MVKKYPLLLKPVIKDYLWGGDRLKKEFGFKCDTPTAAEGWMLSLHKDGTNTVLNGEYAGKRLDEVLELFGEKPDTFPILIKLIDAKDKLSVQVHPDDTYAYKTEGEPGKTEMWYIIDCAPGAELVYGFNRDITKSEFKERIQNNTLNEVLNFVPVKKGDVFFIKSGTLHAIGKGILIAEIQQNSNTTYRVSDYGRLGADLKPRELHINKALDVTCLLKSDKFCDEHSNTKTDFGSIKTLAECEYFKVKKISLNGKTALKNNTFSSLLILDGCVLAEYDGGKIAAKKGDSIYVPCNLPLTLTGTAEIIMSQQ